MEIYSTRGVEFHGGFPKVEGALRKNQPVSMVLGADRHMSPGSANKSSDATSVPFAGALKEAIGGVESLDHKAQDLTRRAILDPTSVDAHTVMIASEKARFALTLTKTIADGVVRAYRELSSPR